MLSCASPCRLVQGIRMAVLMLAKPILRVSFLRIALLVKDKLVRERV